MDSIVTISNVKENILEFNAEIKGIDKSDMVVHFIILANGVDLGFSASHISDDKWEVLIPPLPLLERTAYPFYMNVDCGGYHFEPLRGTVNVVGSSELYLSTPTQQTVKPSTEKPATDKPTAVNPNITLEGTHQKAKRVGPTPSNNPPKRVQNTNVDDLVKRVVEAKNPITPRKAVAPTEGVDSKTKAKTQVAQVDKTDSKDAIVTVEAKHPKTTNKKDHINRDEAIKRILTKPTKAKKVSKTLSDTKLVKVVESTPTPISLTPITKSKPKIKQNIALNTMDAITKNIIDETKQEAKIKKTSNAVNVLKKVDDTKLVETQDDEIKEEKVDTTLDNNIKQLLGDLDDKPIATPQPLNKIKKL